MGLILRKKAHMFLQNVSHPLKFVMAQGLHNYLRSYSRSRVIRVILGKRLNNKIPCLVESGIQAHSKLVLRDNSPMDYVSYSAKFVVSQFRDLLSEYI